MGQRRMKELGLVALLVIFGYAIFQKDSEVSEFKSSAKIANIVLKPLRSASKIHYSPKIDKSTVNTPANKTLSKWIVVTSINHPTEDIKRLASLPEWTLVVVADTKTPKNWSWPGVHFLSVEKQLCLGLSLPQALPFKTYTRKNVGYLYAIMNGAEWIYDTDDDNKPYGRGLDQFDYGETVSGLRYTPRGNINEKLFNPYRFFGYKDMWPRGFPLEWLKDHTNGKDRLISCREMKTAAVQQGIVHKDPDVDAIYRLLHADRKSGLNTTFNKFAPPVLLESGTYSPWNSQNTLFHRRAFFTMFLPTTVEFRVTDIWRSYFSQKLLHLIGESIAFYPVNALQIRNAHNYLADFEDEIAVYTKSGKIVDFIEKFHCLSTKTEECVMELAESFANNSFIQSSELHLIKEWIADLKTIGYKFPPLSNRDNMKLNITEFRGNCRSAKVELKAEEENSEYGTTSRSVQKVEYFNDILSWCNNGNRNPVQNLPSPRRVDSIHRSMSPLEDKKDTVAVFINNYPWKQSIGFLQRLYSPYFAATIFCGSWNPEAFLHDELPIIHPVNFVNLTEEEAHKGYLFYYCVSKVRDLRLQNVKGYYFIADDSVFNFWHEMPMDVTLRSKYTYFEGAWWYKFKEIGEYAAKSFVELMEGKYANDERVQGIWKEYDRRVRANGFPSGKEAIFNLTGRTLSDFFYITSSDFQFFADMSELLSETKLFVEIAVYKILHALKTTVMENFEYEFSTELYDQPKFYNSSSIGLHPIKMSLVHEDKRHRKLFCTKVISAFHANLFHPHMRLSSGSDYTLSRVFNFCLCSVIFVYFKGV